MRTAPYQRRSLPAAQFLQNRERRAVLHVPRGLGVPEIVPAEVCIPARLSALYQALVLSCYTGIPSYVNRCTGFNANVGSDNDFAREQVDLRG